MGYTIGGLGYNINKTGNHYLIYSNEADNPIYSQDGIVTTNAYNYDYWSYWVKDATEDTWEYSQWGASSRKLIDGSWDGWSFLDDMSQWEGKPLGNKFTPALPE